MLRALTSANIRIVSLGLLLSGRYCPPVVLLPCRPKLTIWMLADVKALNIHRQVDVKLNELAKQILMLLPLLLLLYVSTT